MIIKVRSVFIYLFIVERRNRFRLFIGLGFVIYYFEWVNKLKACYSS